MFPRGFDDLVVERKRIRCGDSGLNGVDHPVVNQAKDSPALKVDAESLRIEKICPEQGLGYIRQDELVTDPSKLKWRVDFPYVMIPVPLAARRKHEPSEASLSDSVAGNTETSAPELARNSHQKATHELKVSLYIVGRRQPTLLAAGSGVSRLPTYAASNTCLLYTSPSPRD